MAVAQISLWRMRQEECPNDRRFDNSKSVDWAVVWAVVWAVGAEEPGFPKQTDGKWMVQEWRAALRTRRSPA